MLKAPKESGSMSGPNVNLRRYVNGALANDFGSFPISRMYAKTQGENVPGYHQKLRQGLLLPFTNFVQHSIDGQCVSAVCAITQNGNPATFTEWRASSGSTVPCPELTWLVTETEMKNLASTIDASYFVQAAAARMYSKGWDALTFVAEITQTRRLLVDFTKKVANEIRRANARHTVGGSLGRISDAVSNRKREGAEKAADLWLQGRYGWRSLWLDMKDIHQMLTNVDDGRRRFREVAGTKYENTTVTQTVQNDGNRNFTRLDTVKVEVSVRGTVVADISPPKIVLNPVTTTWEVLRLSFVIDWIINVGQFLEAMTFLALQTDYRAAGGVYLKFTRNTDYQLGSFNNGWAGVYDRGGGDSVGSYTIRTPMSVPTTPLVKLRLNAFKVADLASLITQAFKK